MTNALNNPTKAHRHPPTTYRCNGPTTLTACPATLKSLIRGLAYLPLVLGVMAPSLATARPVKADFNGDGIDDLAVGHPGKNLVSNDDQIFDAGAVSVLFGSQQGLSNAARELWHQDSPRVPEGADDFDSFGRSLAAGDFFNKGFDDLAIGIPFESFESSSLSGAGLMQILAGQENGLSVPQAGLITEGTEAQTRAHLGLGLSSSDLNGDGLLIW